MSFSLVGCRAKVKRAKAQIDALEPLLAPYTDSLFLRVDLELNGTGQSGECVVKIERIPEPVPPDVVVVIGEIVQNLRSALDYLAHEMTAVGEGRFDDSQWPIAKNSSDLKRFEKTLKRVTSEHRALIERLQPHDGRNVEMAVLRDLSNTDKHRLLSATGSYIDFNAGLLDLVVGHDCTLSLRRIENGPYIPGAPLARYTVHVTGKNPSVKMRDSPIGKVGLIEADWTALEVLQNILAKVGETIEEAAETFPA
jgi:hypothetical protein